MELDGEDVTKRKAAPSSVQEATYKLRRKLQNAVYRVPMTLQGWGDEQAAHETNWADLFFDLVFVAILVQLGNLLVADLNQADSIRSSFVARGLLWFAVLYVVTMDAWSDKTVLRSRFLMDSLYHKATDLVQSCVVAVFGMHIVSVDDLVDENGYNYVFALVLSIVLYEAMINSTYVEVVVHSKEEVAVSMSRTLLKQHLLSSLPLVAALGTSFANVDWRITLALIAAHPFARRVKVFYRSFCGPGFNQSKNIPIHIGYLIERTGEWTMINIGEGVLQLIITPLNEDHVFQHFITFIASFFILGFLQLLHYRLSPMDPNNHAARKSSKRGLLLVQISVIMNMAVSVTGVGLKSNLKNLAKSNKPEYQVFTYILCAALCTSVVTMILSKLMHVGPYEIVNNTPKKYLKKRIMYWVARTVLPGLFLFIPGAALKGYYNAALCLGVTVLLLIVNVGDELQADEYRSAEFDLDLERRSVGELEKDLRRFSVRSGSVSTAMYTAASATPAGEASAAVEQADEESE